MNGLGNGLGRIGRVLFGLAMVLFGLLCLIFASGSRAWPVIGPPWTEGSTAMALLVGGGLIAAGVCIVIGWQVRVGGESAGRRDIVTGVVGGAVAGQADSQSENGWTIMFELVAMGAGALALAGAAGRPDGFQRVWVRVGRYLFAISLVVFAVQHFMYGNFILACADHGVESVAFFLGGVCGGCICWGCGESADRGDGSGGDDAAWGDVSAVGGGAACASGDGCSA